VPAEIAFAEKPVLTGALVALRPVCAADAQAAAGVDAETLRLAGTHQTHTLAELERWYGSRAEHADRLDLAIVERAADEWAGEVVLMDLDASNYSCGLRIFLARSGFFGRGLGTEAVRLILAYAYDRVGLHRVELEVYDFNQRARHVYEKIGFIHEGTKRQALRWDGGWVDAHLMSILAPEWAGHRGRPGHRHRAAR
jgi:RimJ/RimL family protein N-acetyltransferase